MAAEINIEVPKKGEITVKEFVIGTTIPSYKNSFIGGTFSMVSEIPNYVCDMYTDPTGTNLYDYFLLESGGFLALESGYALLLEAD